MPERFTVGRAVSLSGPMQSCRPASTFTPKPKAEPMPERDEEPEMMIRRGPVKPEQAAPVAPTTAEQVFDSLLRSNAEELSRAHSRIREAESTLRRERTERDRLQSIREGMQKALEAVRASGGSSVAPSA